MLTRVPCWVFAVLLYVPASVSLAAGDDGGAPGETSPAAPAAPAPPPGMPAFPPPPAPGADPFSVPPAAPGNFDPYSMPAPAADPNAAFTGLPGFAPGGAVPGAPGASAVPAPPPLTTLGLTDSATTGTTGTLATGPVEIYEFLFREDDDLGIVRGKYTLQEAEQIRNREINAFMATGGAPGAVTPVQPNNQGQDPRGGASWDFYYQQLELYGQYMEEKILAGVPDVPSPTYDATSTEDAVNKANTLKESYDLLAIQLTNEQTNENRDFYELRLQTREDRRRNYYEWLSNQQRALDEWTKIWARKINGLKWANEPVRLDDWYYGTNFATPDSVAVNVDGRSYLISKQPEQRVPPEQLNVLSTNLTPYDIIDGNGVLKTPDMERLRGTTVRPYAEEITTTGTIEIVE